MLIQSETKYSISQEEPILLEQKEPILLEQKEPILLEQKEPILLEQIQSQSLDISALELTSLQSTQKYDIEVIGSPVTAAPFCTQVEIMLEWASNCLSKVVCVANVHMLMEAYFHPEFRAILKNADIVTPDGMPLVWMLKLLGAQHQDRVAGMDILLALCQLAPMRNVSIFFLGSETTILEKMRQKLERDFPDLEIAGMEPLPFRPLTKAEDEAIAQKIHDSGAAIVLVSLGCPKQEYWMNQHKDKIQAVMIGLGGVFPVYAGIHKHAPLWIRNLGLEWFYRLMQEPRRLWKRYRTTIPPFIWLACKQLASSKLKFM